MSCGSGGQWGGNNSTAGVYAACVKLRDAVAQKLGFNSAEAVFADDEVRSGNRAMPLAQAAAGGELIAEDFIEYGDLDKKYQQSTFGAHFVEVGVDVRNGRDAGQAYARGVRRGSNPQSQVGAQPGYRSNDDGSRRRADGGAGRSTSGSAFSSIMISRLTKCLLTPTFRIRT